MPIKVTIENIEELKEGDCVQVPPDQKLYFIREHFEGETKIIKQDDCTKRKFIKHGTRVLKLWKKEKP